MPESDEMAGLVEGFWAVMTKSGADFTNTFRDLSGLTKQTEMTD